MTKAASWEAAFFVPRRTTLRLPAMPTPCCFSGHPLVVFKNLLFPRSVKFSLAFLKREIERSLRASIRKKRPRSLSDPSHYLLASGGKRLRSVLLLLSSMVVGGSYKRALPAAAAVELLHNFSLVHDDIMDHDDMRRGRETVHKKWDADVAILAGDFLSALSIQALAQLGAKEMSRALPIFAGGYVALCEGQAMDKEFEVRTDVTLKPYLRMIAGKTAALFSTAAEIGAVIGGGTTKQIKALRQFGHDLGMAFQIQDDLLDIIADEAVLGKNIGSDLIEKKKTYVSLTVEIHPGGRDLLNMFNMSNSEERHLQVLQEFREFLQSSGIQRATEIAIRRYLTRARKHLVNLPDNSANSVLRRIVHDTETRQH